MPPSVRVAPSVRRAMQQVGDDNSVSVVTEFRTILGLQPDLGPRRFVATGHGKSSALFHLVFTEVGDGDGWRCLVDCAIGDYSS